MKNYNHKATEYTPLRSFGNTDTVFNDGMECGISLAAYEVGKILGIGSLRTRRRLLL